MTEPTTVNIGLIIPNTGDLPGVWGANAINPDFNFIDGFFGGVQTIGVSNANIVLTAPAGSITPSPGPTQAQNCVLRFTGALTTSVQVTLPLPGRMTIENLTTGNFILSFAAASAGNVVAIDQGEVQDIENDGTNVKFINMGRVANIEYWAGVASMPLWVTSCTVPPYLLCDGSTYNFSQFPYLGNRLKGQFGGNGSTTFGVPDGQGRVFLGFDGTGTRITTAGCGINGQSLGAAGGVQNETLVKANLPPYTPGGSVLVQTTVAVWSGTISSGGAGTTPNPGTANYVAPGTITNAQVNSTGVLTGTAQGGTSTPVPIVQPSQVGGIWVIKT